MAGFYGKIVGGAIGLGFGGPVGLFVGAAIGHAVDMNLGHLSLFDASAAQQSFFQALFLIMGHIAKADGRVS
ncbi:MAG: co-chaperone DjlA, partial [Pseudomonadota bacterium]